MKFSKIFIFVILLVSTMTVAVKAQPLDYEKGWKSVDSLMNKQFYSRAFDKSQQLFDQARRSHDSRNSLAGAHYLSLVGSKFKEDNSDSSLARYQRLLPSLGGSEKALCHLFLAVFYADYYNNNSWQIWKNSATDERELDYKLWDDDRFRSVAESHIREAFIDKETLKKVPADSMRLFLREVQPGKDGDLTPTLFDVMVANANDVYRKLNFSLLNDRNFENMGDLASTTDRFGAIVPRNVDSTQEMSAFILSLNQERERMHQSLGSTDRVMIKLCMERLNDLYYYASIDNVSEMRMKALPDIIAHFRKGNDESITLLYYMLADLYFHAEMEVETMALVDTALALHPDSYGAVNCYNLKQSILHPTIGMEVPSVIPSDRYGLGEISVMNVDTLFFRIVDYLGDELYIQDAYRMKLLKSPARRQWTFAVRDRHDYRMRSLYFAIPPMPQGRYLLLASTNRAFDTIVDAVTLRIEDVAIVSTDTKHLSGFVVNRKDGTPVQNQEVSIMVGKRSGDKKRILATAKTDKQGHFDFSAYDKSVRDYYWRYYSITYNGLRIEEDFQNYGNSGNDRENQKDLFFDRPVYKPGDTVHFSLLNYAKDRYDGSVVKGMKNSLVVYDINHKAVDTIPFTTDEFGTANGHYAIPAGAMPGYWRVQLSEMSRWDGWTFKVEAYKQPKFTVTLSKAAEMRSFGKAAHVEGVAASYSAVPISGATVTYRIVRSEKRPYWKWGWWNWWHPVESETVATGELTTDDKGFFCIEFVPQPDSVSNLRRKPSFDYKVSVSVTDINGETHEANISLAVGYENCYLGIDVENDTVNVCRYNLDGNKLDGTVTLTVEKLRTPPKALLHSDMFGGEAGNAEMPYSRAEFERMFPYLDYMDSMSDYSLWPVEKKVFGSKGITSAEKPYAFCLAGREAGVYKLTAVMITDEGDTIESGDYHLYEPKGGKMPVQSNLFVVQTESSTCHVGDTVHLRVGSRHDDVTLYVLMRKKDVCYRHWLCKLSRGFIDIDIPVSDSLLGGFVVELAAMKENLFDYSETNIEVPYREKVLDVSLETFRDKLVPGTPERWTLRIKEKYTDHPAEANLVMTMYDAALDKYGSLSWLLNPWTQSYTYGVFKQINSNAESRYVWNLPCRTKPYPDYYRFHRFELKDRIYSISLNSYASARGESLLLRKESKAFSNSVLLDKEEGEVELYAEAEELDDAATPLLERVAADSGQRLSAAVATAMEKDADGEMQIDEPLHIRQNLSTLAFFHPTLRSDDNGMVELSFDAPDLLTKWNVRGLAWTKDLKVGTLSRTVVTQKPLMVVPNVPRFLRHGDTCLFSVKVSNMDDKEQNIAITLRMTKADGGNVLPMIVGDTVRTITLRAGTSGQVHFTLAVPRAPIFVANYMVVARGQGCSDGEQAPIPLLPSRQLVTESLAFYINGAGEKHYEMKRLTAIDTTDPEFTLSTLGLTVDLTPNPIWMVMQSLPYVQQCQNPSNIYLANAIYTNSLSYAIVNNNPAIEQMFREWENGTSSGGARRGDSCVDNHDAFISELERNQDLKQTVMDETPWLRDAVGEEQRHRDVARFFNKATIERQLKKDIDRLLDAQRSDGGWSWIDGARYSCLYTTQYILKTFGLLQRQGVQLDARTRRALDRAMDFVDQETYTYYRKYIKNRGYDVVNLDYLYARSYYPDNKLSKKQKEAYDFFYNNAIKYNKSYESLFTQAMLSVVFNRHGDKALAREMAKRIKEKALYSDEMGMYWRDNVSGWSWSERPIETQAMLIRTMDEVLGDRESVVKMQQWILKQKQTTNWNTDVSTVNAIQALLGSQSTTSAVSSPVRIEPSKMTLTFGNHHLVTDTARHQLHLSHRLQREEVTPADGHLTIRKEDSGIAWGAMYWQYFEQVDKIPASSMGVTLKRTLYRVERDGTLSRIGDAGMRVPSPAVKVGDKVRVRIEIVADRNLEYVELKDPRCAAMEPVSTASGWHWNAGLSYYLSVTNTAQTLFIDRLNKGKYVVEYDMYVNNAGTYVTAPTTIQCLYAPEFRALCPAETLNVNL